MLVFPDAIAEAAPAADASPAEEIATQEDANKHTQTMKRRKLLTEQIAEEEAAKKGRRAKPRSKRKEDNLRAEHRAKAKPRKSARPRMRAETPESQPDEVGKRPRMRREAKRAAEGKTIGFNRQGTKTASIVDFVAEHPEGVTPALAAKTLRITVGAAQVRLWRATMAGKLKVVGEQRKDRRYVTA